MQPVSDLSQAQRIDSVCDRFEADWKAGRRFPVDAYLTDFHAVDREALRLALLAVQEELEKNGGSGETSVSQQSERTGVHEPASPDLVGDTLGRFEIVAQLGEGAFGKVYKARDPQLERDVAIKVPKLEAFSDWFDLSRFLREARSAASIQHANICPVHEVGTENGQPYIVMAFIPGKSLAEYLKERSKPLPQKQAALIVRKLALALHAAHDRGIVHRDLKPANILFDPQRRDVVITDFGLAVRTNGDDRQTQSGALMGTPAYMSPEQARGDVKKVGPASDIFALGVILYELLTGRRPFQGTLGEVIGQVQHVEPPSPRSLDTTIDARLDAVCRQAMTKDPEQRFASMKAMAAAIESYLRDQSNVSAPEKSPPVPEVEQSTGLAQVMAALSAERRAETEAAIEAAVSKSRIPLWKLLAPAGLLGILITLGIIFFARTPTATVMINIDVDLSDKTLSFLLDKKLITAEQLRSPIELKVGSHELLVKRGDQVIRHFAFTVSRDAGPRIELRESPQHGPQQKDPDPGKSDPLDDDEAFARWAVSQGARLTLRLLDGGSDLHVARPADLPKERFKVIGCDVWGNQKITDANSDGIVRWLARSKSDTTSFHGTSISDATVAKLVKLPTIRQFSLGGTKITDRALELLGTRDDLTSLGLDGTAITDRGLAYLQNLKQLEVFSAYNTRISDQGARHLSGLTRLRALTPGATDVTVDGVRMLKELPIEELHLSDCRKIRPADLAVIVNDFPKLRRLSLVNLFIGDAGISHLTSLKKLEWLHLGHNRITDRGLTKLARMKNLRELHLSNNPVTEAGLLKLRQALPGCRIEPEQQDGTDRKTAEWVLRLGGTIHVYAGGRETLVKTLTDLPSEQLAVTQIDFKGNKLLNNVELQHLGGLKRLESLHISDTEVGDGGLAHLARLKSLRSLGMVNVRVTDAGLVHLKELTELRSLQLSNPGITGPGLAHLKHLTRLEYLELQRTPLSGNALGHLAPLTSLQHLALDGSPITDAMLSHLKGPAQLPYLSLAHTKVTDAGLVHLKALPNLRELHLYVTAVGDGGLEHLKSLIHLRIIKAKNTKITEAGGRKLTQFLPQCQIEQ